MHALLRSLSFTALLALSATVVPAEAPSITEGTPVAIPRAKQYDLTSAINGRTYRVFVSTPFGAEPGKKYPVVYFIDGNWYFGPATYNETESGGAGSIEHAIIVGVGYATEDNNLVGSRRAFELTPSSPPQPEAKGKFGGGDVFLRVFDDEIIPFVNAHYPVDLQRQSLYGKSFGGLFALHQLFRKPEQFSTYIIVSPAIGWNDGDILKEEPSFVARAKAGEIKVRILFTAAADESPRMVADAKAISERLAPLNPQKVHVEYVAFAGEDHVSVSLASVGRALFFALKKR